MKFIMGDEFADRIYGICKIVFFLFFLIFSPCVTFSQIKNISFSLDQSLPKSKWSARENQISGQSVSSKLALARKNFDNKHFNDCIKLLSQIRPLAKEIEPWLLIMELKCSRGLLSTKKKETEVLHKIFLHVKKTPDLLLNGPHKEDLRSEIILSRFMLCETDLKIDRTRAWNSIEELMATQEWLDSKQKAKLYELAGKLAFADQNISQAEGFFYRSLAEYDSTEIREKLKQISKSYWSYSEKEKLQTQIKYDEDLESTARELELVKRMSLATKSGDFVSAVEDGLSLIKEFPGGRRADWASDRIKEVYLSVLEKKDEKYQFLKSRLNQQLIGASSLRIFDWAKIAYERGYYKEALVLSRASYSKIENLFSGTQILRILSRSAWFTGDYELALQSLGTLVVKHAGTTEAVEALLNMGYIQLRRGNYSEAAAHIERFLVLPNSKKWELSALYWLYRALQKMNSPRASEYANQLMNLYPLTYYGLKLKAEKENGWLKWEEIKSYERSWTQWISQDELKSWTRLLLLIEGGWFKEAQAELKAFPFSNGKASKLFQAKLWGLAFHYPEAIRIFNEVSDKGGGFDNLNDLRIGFPFEFSLEIEKEGKKRSVDFSLIRGLIRQESSYQLDVVSSAQAHGLMQILTSTAKEIAHDLEISKLKFPDQLYDPQINIRLGVFYLSQLIKRYKGHIPLALGAYNAGIGRINHWIEARNLEKDFFNDSESDPQMELWIDELPWPETSFYIKAVLRNMLIYQLLDKGPAKLNHPVWKISTN